MVKLKGNIASALELHLSNELSALIYQVTLLLLVSYVRVMSYLH